MSFGEHLEELRSRMILALLGVVIATIICFVWTKDLLGFVIRPAFVVLSKYNQEPSLQSLSPPDTFLIYLKITILCGLILSSPWVLWHAWQFVASGLYQREQKFIRRFGMLSPVLFAMGVCFMFFIVLPLVLNFFTGFNLGFPVPDWELSWLEKRLVGPPEESEEVSTFDGMQIPVFQGDPESPSPGSIWFNQKRGQLKVATGDGKVYQQQMRSAENVTAVTNQYSIDFYVSFILRLSLAFGIAFQMPIVVIFLVITGMVTLQSMSQARKYVILAIVICAAMLTPPDVISQILLAIPMMILFEVGLLISRMMQKARG